MKEKTRLPACTLIFEKYITLLCHKRFSVIEISLMKEKKNVIKKTNTRSLTGNEEEIKETKQDVLDFSAVRATYLKRSHVTLW